MLVVFLVALGARSAWGLYRFSTAVDPAALEFPDEVQYWDMARSLWSGDGLRDELGFRATRMPLYPALLAPFTAWEHGVHGAKVFQWIVGSVGAVLAFCLGARLFDRRVGLLSGLYVALDPFLVFFSSLLLTETLFVSVLLWLWFCASLLLMRLIADSGSIAHANRGNSARSHGLKPEDRKKEPECTLTNPGVAGLLFVRRCLIIGMIGSLAVYSRESSLGLVLLLIVMLCWIGGFRRHSLLGAALSVCTVFAALLPWALRNYAQTGDLCFLTHRSGISLYDGVGPSASGASDLGDAKAMEAVKGLDEVAWNEYFLSKSKEAIINDPARIVRLAGVKLARLWNPVPNVESYQSRWVRAVAAGWMVPTLGLSLLGGALLIVRRGSRGVWLTLFLLLPALYLSALHSLFVGSVRYRLGAMPMLGLLAAYALTSWLKNNHAAQYRCETHGDKRT